MINITYDQWAEEVGIFKDEESREAWDFQQNRIDVLKERIEQLEATIRRRQPHREDFMQDYDSARFGVKGKTLDLYASGVGKSVFNNESDL